MDYAVVNLFTLQPLLLDIVKLIERSLLILLRFVNAAELNYLLEALYIYLLDSELYFSNFLIPNLKRC